MSRRFLRVIILASSLAGGSFSGLSVRSQTSPPLQALPHHSPASFAAAANRWQLTAIDPRTQVDTVAPAVRTQRNAYWKTPLETIRDRSRGSAATFIFPGPYLADSPEFPSVKGAAWIIAVFESFHVFAIDPEYQLIYTEMNFRVEQVIKQPASLSLSTGELIDADVPGGRIKPPSGDIISWLITPRQYFFQPSHTYLMQVVYQAGGSFFAAYKRWDVSSGKVKPDDPGEIYRAQQGNSSIDGMSVPDLVTYLPSVLPDEPEK